MAFPPVGNGKPGRLDYRDDKRVASRTVARPLYPVTLETVQHSQSRRHLGRGVDAIGRAPVFYIGRSVESVSSPQS